jgi:predicted  nucleic acid-binding Zn-ribbon protein
MSNPNPPIEPSSSISAAELRRRLLASTPPPIAATASTPDPQPVEEVVPETPPVTATWAPGSLQELLARLKMPGKSGPIQVPTPRQGSSTAAVPVPVPSPSRTAVNRRTPLPSNNRLESSNAIAGALNQLADYPDTGSHGGGRYQVEDSPHGETQRLRSENKELRTLLGEMKHLLQEASDTEQQLVAKEKEFEVALASKDGQIEELNSQLGAIEEQIAKGELAPPPPVPKTRTELEEWGDELEKENAKLQQDRKRLDDDRRQLREDEEALETQMREMEVAMARERALIARQETELRRLSAEIQHELELVQRGDSSLRDQMVKFQRRAQEVITKPAGGGNNGRR